MEGWVWGLWRGVKVGGRVWSGVGLGAMAWSKVGGRVWS